MHTGTLSAGVADPEVYPMLRRVARGEARLTDAEALRLFESRDLLALGQAAHKVRMRLHPEQAVTFVIDRNINYTNVCICDCRFCAFYRKPGHAEGYVIDEAALRAKIDELYAAGGSQVLLQGGHNPDLPFEYYEDLLRRLKSAYPGLHIHGFSPPEIGFLRDHFGMPLTDVLGRLKAAGLDSLPGGGAEILSERVRAKLSPGKVGAADWIEVMRVAHGMGLRSSATMMYGLIESYEERVEHLRRLRDLQEATGGFTAFIAWNFQPANSENKDRFAGAFEYLKTIAIARLYLDNFANIQASWVTQGAAIAQLSLLMGVNDLGGLMLEENVVSAAGTRFRCSVEDLARWSGELGFAIRQRNYFYQPYVHPVAV